MDFKSKTYKEDKLLKKHVKNEKSPNWEAIAESFQTRGFKKTSKQCRDRWRNQLDPSLARGQWTDQDSKRLFDLHNQLGSQWKKISLEFRGRTDNFLKNQFFSLLRRSLRRICKHLQVPKSSDY